MSRFDNDGICRECLQPREVHRLVLAEGPRGLIYPIYGCIDPTIPDLNRDDDPWQPPAYEPEPRIAALFDPVMV